MVPVIGIPNPGRICTGILERQHLTVRMRMRCLTPLANMFSKKRENLWAAGRLHFAHYGFRRGPRPLRVMAAMEAVIADLVWNLAELLRREGTSKQAQAAFPLREVRLTNNQANRGVWMQRHVQVRCALGVNGLGAVLLLFAFQATSARLLLVTDATANKAAFCIGDRAVFGVVGPNTFVGSSCPQGLDVKPTAVVNSEHGWLFPLGLVLTVISIIWQIALVEKPPPSRQLLRQQGRKDRKSQ